MTAVSFLDDDTFLGAENKYNLFVARKRADAPTEEERGRLEVSFVVHLAGGLQTRLKTGPVGRIFIKAFPIPAPSFRTNS
jgi:DNA damage-binding protein 1